MSTNREFGNRVIPFYGGKQPRLFEIERRCMDRDGKVIAFLDQHLPDGLVLDVGAGNGFTAMRLSTPQRTVVPLEPDATMVDATLPLLWTWGVAQDIPFRKLFQSGLTQINGSCTLTTASAPKLPLFSCMTIFLLWLFEVLKVVTVDTVSNRRNAVSKLSHLTRRRVNRFRIDSF